MKKKNLLLCACSMALGLLVTSCEDKEYISLHPEFSDMEFKMLEDGSTELRAGEKILATAIQSKKGSLLNHTEYNWSADTESVSHKFRKTVIYDKETFNPCDTLIFEKPGTYNLTFNGKYYTSGDFVNFGKRDESIENGKVSYAAPSFLFYTVSVRKRLVVK